MQIDFTLNGKRIQIDTDPLRRLLDVLRIDFHLTGVKEGCGEGECGACTTLLNGKPALSCLIPIGIVQNTEILTIEGYRKTERYKILQDAFSKAGSVQCGFCTPGFIMAAEGLLRRNAQPDENAIREAISGNLCRCTGYKMIIDGIKVAASKGKGLWEV